MFAPFTRHIGRGEIICGANLILATRIIAEQRVYSSYLLRVDVLRIVTDYLRSVLTVLRGWPLAFTCGATTPTLPFATDIRLVSGSRIRGCRPAYLDGCAAPFRRGRAGALGCATTTSGLCNYLVRAGLKNITLDALCMTVYSHRRI